MLADDLAPVDGPAQNVGGGVTVVLVSHDGAAWLPTVLAALDDQSLPPSYVVAVDTGSRDASPDLLRPRVHTLVTAPRSTGYPAAVALGLAEAERAGRADEWIWLLHDDSAPDPGALAGLLAAAQADPDADLLGPKLREWPSLRRLLEVGVTISGTGQRETGLEAGEYDQGQHDRAHAVLAVNTAGLLVRRDAWQRLGGLEDELPVYGADLDLGWRAAAAGLRTVVVPAAVLFHVEAAQRGLRRTPLTGTHPHLQRRRAGLFTVLANSRPGALWLQVPRLVIGTLLRMLGFLVVREPGRALDDLVALLAVLARPRTLLAARRRRARARTAEQGDVRRLLAPPWVPYRHGLDLVGDVAAALSVQAGDVAERRREAAAGRDPSSFAARRSDAASVEGAAEDTGLVARFLTNPVAVVLALVVVVALIGSRHALGAVSGGGLAPAPGSASDWWALLVQSRHPLLQGTTVPAPAYLGPLALLATVLLGSPAAAVSVVLLACLPVGLWGAWRFLRVLGRLASPQGMPRWLILWGATSYAVLPAVSGAWGDGRLGPVVAGAMLPWLAHAALGFADPEADRRWRAGWRTGLLATVVVAFAPPIWPVLALVVVAVLVAVLVLAGDTARDRSVWGPLAALPAVPVLLLAPWWVWSLATGSAEGLLLDVGRLPQARVSGLELLAGRLDGLGAPLAVGLVLPVLAILALVPRRSRLGVVLCWSVAAAVGVLAAALAPVDLDLAALRTGPGLSLAPVLVHGALLVAVVLAGQAVVEDGTSVRGRAAAWRRVGLGALVVVAGAVPVVGLGWFVVQPGPTPGAGDDDIPAYMVQSAEQGPEHGILVLRGSVDDGLRYVVRRGDGITLGEDEVVALSPRQAGFAADVRALVADPGPTVVQALAADGIEHVVLPAPADGEVAATLDATPGLVQAGTEDRRSRAWRVDRPLDESGVAARTSWPRTVAVIGQGLALLVVLVLCLPALRPRRRPV